jgi:hypothetical protein
MPDRAILEAFRKAREAFDRYVCLEAGGGTSERIRALSEYVKVHDEFTRAFDDDLRQRHGGASASPAGGLR